MPNSTVEISTSDVMSRLKTETRGAHDATEAIPFSEAILERRLPREQYVAQLHAYRIIHRALEEELSSSNNATVASVWRDDLRKLPFLDADVSHFDPDEQFVSAKPQAAAEAFADAIRVTARKNPVALLGYLYVLEGSTLGGIILGQHVRAMYNLEDGAGMSYYTPYGRNVMPRWQEFKQRMNDSITNPEDQNAAVGAASSAFEHIGNVLRALSQETVAA